MNLIDLLRNSLCTFIYKSNIDKESIFDEIIFFNKF